MSEFVTEGQLDDFQHQVERRIEKYKDCDDFPRLEQYKTTQEELDNYLFDYQAILDSDGTERSRYTTAGLIIIIPVVILAFMYPVNDMPLGQWTLLVAILAGLVLWLLVRAVQKLLMKSRIQRLNRQQPSVCDYVRAVMKYEQTRR